LPVRKPENRGANFYRPACRSFVTPSIWVAPTFGRAGLRQPKGHHRPIVGAAGKP
jgi:hypothetical protein